MIVLKPVGLDLRNVIR